MKVRDRGKSESDKATKRRTERKEYRERKIIADIERVFERK